MKNTTRKTAAILAAAMMMTMTAAIGASANNDENVQAETTQEYVSCSITSAHVSIRGNGSVSGEVGTNTSNPDMTASGHYSSIHLTSSSLREKIYLKAAADEGWTFVRWVNAKTGKTFSTKKNLTIKDGESADLIAEFKADAASKPEAAPAVQPETKPEAQPEAEAPAQKGTSIFDLISIDEIVKVLPLDIF